MLRPVVTRSSRVRGLSVSNASLPRRRHRRIVFENVAADVVETVHIAQRLPSADLCPPMVCAYSQVRRTTFSAYRGRHYTHEWC